MVKIDIDMPKSCDMCPLIVPVFSEAYCKITGEPMDETYDVFRLDDCPLKEVKDEVHQKE